MSVYRSRIADIRAELDRIAALHNPTAADESRQQALIVELSEVVRMSLLETVMTSSRRPGAVIESGDGASGYGSRTSNDPWHDEIPTHGDAATLRGLVGRARTAVERSDAVDHGRERITAALDSENSENQSRIARWAIATSDPAYSRAFFKIAADPENGHREFTGDELAAYRRVRSEARALSLTDANGGYLVPFQLDPTVVISNAGATNTIRSISRVEVATGDVWNGVTSAGVTTSWVAEGAEIADGSPTFAQPAIPVFKQASWIPVSFEAYDDMMNGVMEITKILNDAAAVADEQAFTLGTGTGQPTGIVTALTGTSSVVNQTGTTLDSPDFFATQEALGPRFQLNASWLLNLSSLNRARQIIAGTGLTTPLLTEGMPSQGMPPTLLGHPAYEASAMDGTVTASAADYLAVYGDFKQFVIAERIGATVELVPHLFGPTRLPTAQRGWLMWRRVGSNVMTANAFRMLNKSA